MAIPTLRERRRKTKPLPRVPLDPIGRTVPHLHKIRGRTTRRPHSPRGPARKARRSPAARSALTIGATPTAAAAGVITALAAEAAGVVTAGVGVASIVTVVVAGAVEDEASVVAVSADSDAELNGRKCNGVAPNQSNAADQPAAISALDGLSPCWACPRGLRGFSDGNCEHQPAIQADVAA